jgi:hypothetical protein
MTDRTVFFGLRSNVKYFSSRLGFARLTNRVKTLSPNAARTRSVST